MNFTPMTVSELNRSVRTLLEQTFPLLWVAGEISNFTRASSGHWYFSLKDNQASVKCVMFRQKNQFLDFLPFEGMQVEARVLVSLYEARGDFQLGVEFLRPAGMGAAYEAFARLKEKLEKEGLFSAERKKKIPSFPKNIGVVTSLKAAALRDILKTLERRMPSIAVTVYPASVQGETAPEEISSAIGRAGAHGKCDILIVARGGGSSDDISAFNTEAVARSMAACPIPIISGVGHETDFTIADFVADMRAPTPTAAAELASPNREELGKGLSVLQSRLKRIWDRGLEFRMQHLDHLGKRLVHPRENLANQANHLHHIAQRLKGSWERGFEKRRLRFFQIAANLDHLNPQKVLERGYSLVSDSSGEIVRTSERIEIGETLDIRFAQGSAKARVSSRS